MRIHRARRVLSAERRGSSLPVVVDTDAGCFFTKLRGAAQGTAALVAEIVVARLAEALGLRVPPQVLITIEGGLPSDDRHEELLCLLAASHGLNLGFELMEGAREIRPREPAEVDDDVACRILWLDALVMNPDRTPRNPNLMKWNGQLWLIDHGAALPFQHDWSRVSEASPRARRGETEGHLFADRRLRLPDWDGVLAARLDRKVLRAAVAEVPDSFLEPLFPQAPNADRLLRRRRAYEAFLWKRLKEPRPFVD